MNQRPQDDNPSLDQELMAAISRGDESALGRLYDRYSGLVYSVALRILRDAAAAEEVLQDIFFQLWRKASQFDATRGSAAGWLMVMARNRSISMLRRKKPGEETELNEATVVLPSRLEDALVQSDLLSKVRGSMDSLPQSQRAVLELAYFEGLTQSEIASRTGEPLGTIKTRLRAALETLREKFA